MTPDECRTMFQANAMLRHSSPLDTRRPELEETLDTLTRKCVREYLNGNIDVASQEDKLTIEQALNVMMNTCQCAIALEFAHHPNGMTDEQIHKFANIRKEALETLVEALTPKS